MSFPPATEMFQFAGFASRTLCIQHGIPLAGWVAPFGDPGINDRSHLPRAFRSVPRPSSPLSAKASTRCPYLRALAPHPTASTQSGDQRPGIGDPNRRSASGNQPPHQLHPRRNPPPDTATSPPEDTSAASARPTQALTEPAPPERLPPRSLQLASSPCQSTTPAGAAQGARRRIQFFMPSFRLQHSRSPAGRSLPHTASVPMSDFRNPMSERWWR